MAAGDGASRRKSWIIGGHTVILRVDLGAGEKYVDVIPTTWIDRWVRDTASSSILRTILLRTSVAPMIGSGSDRMRKALQKATERREIVVLLREGGQDADPKNAQTGTQQQSSSTQSRRRAAEPPPPKKEKTWVEFRLVNDEGKPVPGARYKLKITDGSVREGSLDDNGSVRVPSLDPGMCEISFLDYDQREWKRKS
jgi:hypothetical protein